MEEESCLPVEAERKDQAREVKDLEEAEASGAGGSGRSWWATVEQPTLDKADSEPGGRMVRTSRGQTRLGFSVICL